MGHAHATLQKDGLVLQHFVDMWSPGRYGNARDFAEQHGGRLYGNTSYRNFWGPRALQFAERCKKKKAGGTDNEVKGKERPSLGSWQGLKQLLLQPH